MERAILLADSARGKVSPNPMVGCVIVANNKIIGSGYHAKYGDTHGEVNAINSVRDKSLLKEATLYCTLEPCSKMYPGKKNPPCTQAIINAGIKSVVIGQLDPNPMVSGSGVQFLRDNGISVDVGVLESKCQELNVGYNSVQINNRPYIHLKWAQSLDGRTACFNGESKWISNLDCRKNCHSLRSMYDGIMVGRKTFEKDNPTLDARYGFSPSPRPIIVGSTVKITPRDMVYNRKPIVVRKLDEELAELPSIGINSVFVEGGSNLITWFLSNGLWDRVTIYTSSKIIGEGLSSVGSLGIKHPKDSIQFSKSEFTNLGDTMVFNGWK